MARVLNYLILPITLSFLAGNISAVEQQQTSLVWAGCGITKKAFMAELAKAYEKKTGIKVNLNGGGATKGIRNAQKGAIDIDYAIRSKVSIFLSKGSGFLMVCPSKELPKSDHFKSDTFN